MLKSFITGIKEQQEKGKRMSIPAFESNAINELKQTLVSLFE